MLWCKEVASRGRLALFTTYYPSSHCRKAHLQQNSSRLPNLNGANAQRKCDPSTTYISLQDRKAGAPQRITGSNGSAATSLAQQDAIFAGDAHLLRQPRPRCQHKITVWQLWLPSHVAFSAKPSLELAVTAAHTPPKRLRCLRPGACRHVRKPRG